MSSPRLAAWLLALFFTCICSSTLAQPAVRPVPLKSGIEFTGTEVRALQGDEFANPGMLWISRGSALWDQPAGKEGRACAGCHGEAAAGMKTVATRYPQIDRASGALINLEGRIQQCREQRQHAPPFKYESEELLGLTAYVRQQSNGMPLSISIAGAAQPHFERGREFYYQRFGQMNLSCAQCHQDNWGKKLGPEAISQGHGNPYPIYRLEWQTMGSLHRRFRSCLSGVRAEMLPQGSPAYLDLELYLAWRSGNLPIEAPGVRR